MVLTYPGLKKGMEQCTRMEVKNCIGWISLCCNQLDDSNGIDSEEVSDVLDFTRVIVV